MHNDDKRNERIESYPKPTETDEQLKNQPEYIDQQPNDFEDKSISDVPNTHYARNSDNPDRDIQESDEA
jgi:hypothetical protein